MRTEARMKKYRITYLITAHTEVEGWGIEDAEAFAEQEENDPDVSIDGVSIDGDECSYQITEVKE